MVYSNSSKGRAYLQFYQRYTSLPTLSFQFCFMYFFEILCTIELRRKLVRCLWNMIKPYREITWSWNQKNLISRSSYLTVWDTPGDIPDWVTWVMCNLQTKNRFYDVIKNKKMASSINFFFQEDIFRKVLKVLLCFQPW